MNGAPAPSRIALALIAAGGLFAWAPAALAAAPQKAVTSSSKAAAPARHSALPFIHDDYARALAEARKRDVPLFIESWAPW